jgi:glycosyltransferase involved in cell wall biosynthesis
MILPYFGRLKTMVGDMTRSVDISVVMAVYNGERYLREAIESVLTQSLSDFEFIIVDDGSTDSSRDIVKSYRDDRVVLIENETNRRLPASLNRGIMVARGSLIARMDCDDICRVDRLERQSAFLLSHHDVPAVGSGAIFLEADGTPFCRFVPSDDPSELARSFPGSPFIHPSVMFRKAACEKAGGYLETMRWGAEDAVLFARMARFGPLRNIQEALLQYRFVPAGASRKPAAFRRLLLAMTREAFETGLVAPAYVEAIERQSACLDRTQAHADYYFEIAKLALWSGLKGVRVRAYLAHCTEAPHLRDKVLALRMLSYAPPQFVRSLYRRLKGRRFETV